MSNTCPGCSKEQLEERVVSMTAEMGHDGKSYEVSADVSALVCSSCKRRFFDERADSAMRDQLRSQLGLLQPNDIKTFRDKYNLTQQDVSVGTGLASETISRIEQLRVIQSKATDKLLRFYFTSVINNLIDHSCPSRPFSFSDPHDDTQLWDRSGLYETAQAETKKEASDDLNSTQFALAA